MELEQRRGREWEKSCIFCLTPQAAAIARAQPGWNQNPEASSRSPGWVQEPKYFSYCQHLPQALPHCRIIKGHIKWKMHCHQCKVFFFPTRYTLDIHRRVKLLNNLFLRMDPPMKSDWQVWFWKSDEQRGKDSETARFSMICHNPKICKTVTGAQDKKPNKQKRNQSLSYFFPRCIRWEPGGSRIEEMETFVMIWDEEHQTPAPRAVSKHLPQNTSFWLSDLWHILFLTFPSGETKFSIMSYLNGWDVVFMYLS